MGNLPKRTGKIYGEIASFKKHELRECVAVELALRNSKVASLINKIAIIVEQITANLKPENYNSLKRDSLMKKYQETFNFLLKNYYVNFETINLRHQEDIDTVMLSRLNKNTEAMVFNSNLTLSSSILKYGKHLDRKIIHKYKYSRVPLQLPDYIDKSFDITLNCSLPKNELKEKLNILIDKLYKEQYLKTAHDIYTEEFCEFDNKNAPQKIYGEKLADWFFMYDYYKTKKEEAPKSTDEDIYRDIGIALFYYYKSEDDDIQDIYADTWYKNNKVKMCNLIEKEHYKNLVTGILNIQDEETIKKQNLI